MAVAPGRLIVSDRSKTIQPLEAGVVKSIHVQDGQMVQAGQLLIELDATVSGAENTKQQTNLHDAEINALRAKALLAALDSGQLPVVTGVVKLNSFDFPLMFAQDPLAQGYSATKPSQDISTLNILCNPCKTWSG